MAIDKLKTTSLEDNSITSDKIASGAVTISDIGDNEISMAKLSQVDLTIAPEVLEIQVDAPDAGQATMWKWTWEQSTLPYARRTITNSNELNVPLYKEGTYVVNNFAAYDIHGSMTQTHSLYLKWVDGAGTDNLVSWATSAGPISDTHPDINGGNATDVQRITVNVPATITIPSLTNPSVSYTVVNSGSGSYTFSGAASGDNPNLGPFYRGGTYTVNINATGHPFYFTTDNGTNFSSGTYFGEYTSGVTGSRTDSGTITFTVPAGAPDTLYYQCGNHSAMRGAITVKDLAVETNINGNYVVYFQHTQEGHKTPVELRPIPSLVNQMCLVYDNNTNKFVPQDLATYVENTPSFENKIREVAGTAELVVADGSAVIAKVNVYDDSTYLPLTGNNPGDQAFATDTDILYIWDGSAWQQAGAANSDDLTEGSTNLFFTDARADARISAATTTDLTEGTNLYYTDTRVSSYLSSNDYDTATNIVASITDSAPATLDTLNELAAALGDDANFSTTVTNSIATKLPLAGGTMTGGLVVTAGNGDQLALNNAGERFTQISLRNSGTQNGALWLDDTDSMVDLYANTSHGIRLKTGGDNARVTILSGGNVGIGDTNPAEKFTIKGDGARMTISSNDYEVAMLGRRGSTAPEWDRGYLRMKYDGTNTIVLDTGGVSYLNGGNVGIGTTSPASRLHIKAGSSGYDGGIQIEDTDSTTKSAITHVNGTLYISSNTTADHISILANGNVGIGDGNPTSLLSISKNSTRTTDFENMLKITHTSSGTTGVGFGSAIYFVGERENGVNQAMGRLLFDAEVNSGTNISSGFSVQTATAGSTSEKFRITHDGNVGIGDTNPSYKLSISQQDNVGPSIQLRQAANKNVWINNAGSAGHGSGRANRFEVNGTEVGHIWLGASKVVLGSSVGDGAEVFETGANNARAHKPIAAWTNSGTKYYTHLCTHSAYQTTGTILINTNIPGHNLSGNANMFSFRVTGFWYNYRDGGTIDMVVGAYAGEGDYYNATVTGSYPAAWKGKIWFATNSNDKVMLILGDNGTTQKCEIAVTDFVQGYINVDPSYATGWTISATNTSYTATQRREAHPRTTGGMQIIDGTARTALYSSSGTFTVSQTNTFTPIGSLSDFKIDIHVNVGVSDDEGGGNMNPYANGVIQRRINSGSWTTADNTGISNQGGVSCHVEMSPPRVGTNANTDTYMTQQDRYRTKNHSSTFIDRPSINAGDTLQYRLICNLTNGNHIQIGEPVGFSTDDNYMAQPFGFIVTEFTPWE